MIDPILPNTPAAGIPAAAGAAGAATPHAAPVCAQAGQGRGGTPARPVRPLWTIEQGSQQALVRRLLDVLFPDAQTILDATWGSGEFWGEDERRVVGLDLNPARARDVCGDFTALPFVDGSFDLAVFDPPYITNPGKGGTMRLADRFGAYPSVAAMRESVMAGAREAWRVGRLGCLVKVQDQIRGGKWIEMTEWVREAIGQPPYQRVDALRPAPKILGSNWTEQFSAYGNGATFLAFRRGSQYHRRRSARRPKLRRGGLYVV